MSERITENIVRDLLRENGYYDNPNTVIEEQKSSNPKIDKLLKNASKSGTGKGYPEFIISFKDTPENLVVIECKAQTTKHESKDRTQYKDYAVDGVLLYANYLKDSFNVTAIAVSGDNDKDKKISSFLWLKKRYTYKDIQNKILLKPNEISDVIKKQSKPLDEQELIKKAIIYNDFLHEYSIPEVERCTLISAVLISLQNNAFLNSFQHCDSNKALIKAMLEACENFLKNNKLDENKIEVIIKEYSKFENNKDFNEDIFVDKKNKNQIPNTILREFISQVNDEILPYVKNSEFDILGKFYTQFIRYAGSDKKTGLVLTPHHITDLFCEIAELNSNDVVFDPCCGTAGFLVSAMNYMLETAKYDSGKQNLIKTQQLVGIEKRADMFAHACSNMMMRGDGKSHIIYDNCFKSIKKTIIGKDGKPKLDKYNNPITEEVKLIQDIKENFNPTKAFLNPPYKDGNANEQLEFVENALECLTENGICVAICQMSTVVSDKKSVIEVRERLLEKHTLKAVFSMPNDLFYNIGVITCILVFKAHNPHLNNRETFFGYFKDDGFMKSKNEGRIDKNKKWSDIKKKWLDAYLNKRTIEGLSVMQKVIEKDEWCAEAYMNTDYSKINEIDFITNIKKHIVFQFLIEKTNNIEFNSKNKIESKFKINTNHWKKFKLDDLFDIKKGERINTYNRLRGKDNIPLVTSSSENNGVVDFISLSYFQDKKKIFKNKITIDMFFNVFYQKNDYFSDDNVHTLILKNNENENTYVLIFIATVLCFNKYKYAYGRQTRLHRLSKEIIKLPEKNKKPDWQFMEDYVKSLPYSSNL